MSIWLIHKLVPTHNQHPSFDQTNNLGHRMYHCNTKVWIHLRVWNNNTTATQPHRMQIMADGRCNNLVCINCNHRLHATVNPALKEEAHLKYGIIKMMIRNWHTQTACSKVVDSIQLTFSIVHLLLSLPGRPQGGHQAAERTNEKLRMFHESGPTGISSKKTIISCTIMKRDYKKLNRGRIVVGILKGIHPWFLLGRNRQIARGRRRNKRIEVHRCRLKDQ
mmetsp:Transcript_16920/g.39078  ORF Transcript_16920/g.39078 Transcript_16920/m.39078 type:complete len:221 (+) Transcript_16920:2310-2972(+)